ncbi:hypothetical protein CgunFtcFv8_013079 [Champsocephalus gunnari]|uniref:Secreted protein n=1 Tax=Champsocephalus gunnari TaxID=52237 RepID=A0AAN8DSQ6_CHAGU|nr:hypothetical protein CgunFtcFv8_013079 [Champsocephalus gunnari]
MQPWRSILVLALHKTNCWCLQSCFDCSTPAGGRIPVCWLPSAEKGPLQGCGSTLQQGPVTLLSAPPWDEGT